ncbi:Zn(II)2Cys6 transcription factor [Colletotrichum sojae]|uniref:Zn(II)2Cys6 transcription factor n=1 Tax=Colletotrichum sojae TaxID=2175907 RepID=A0A8H6MY20_9PEZI|nr:Zn(II)2Cys6 transcription factor [Colletotrichum sojae]
MSPKERDSGVLILAEPLRSARLRNRPRFMASLFTDPDLRRNHSELLHVLASVPNATGPQVEPCDLPSMEEAEILFDKYLSWSHVQCPFLCRGEVKALLDRVSSSTPPGSSVPDHDLFRMFMILAVGSVFPYRNGTHGQHPEGYYMAALRYMRMDLLTRGLDSIQNLVLVCCFGIYHRIGTSIWDIIRLCGRLCVEQGLHLDESDSKNLLRVQMKRRVFWQFYMIDRYSSTLLGKSFTIDDRDIETSFPADANDEDLITASQSAHDLGAFQLSHVSLGPNGMTVFFTSVRLSGEKTVQFSANRGASLNLKTAGLCVMFCVSSSSALEREDIQQANFGLSQCEETLRDMIEQLRSARHYVIVFEALRRNTSRKLSRIMESMSSERSSSATTGQQRPSVVSP